MGLSWVGRGALIAIGLVIGLVGLIAWSLEANKGGGTATEDYVTGHLAGGAEVREIVWTGPVGGDGSYTVEAVDGRHDVRWIDPPEGRSAVMFSGTEREVEAWLDARGPVLFEGTQAEVDIWLEDQRSGGRSFPAPGVIVAAGALVIFAGLIPLPRVPTGRTPGSMPPATPATGAG